MEHQGSVLSGPQDLAVSLPATLFRSISYTIDSNAWPRIHSTITIGLSLKMFVIAGWGLGGSNTSCVLNHTLEYFGMIGWDDSSFHGSAMFSECRLLFIASSWLSSNLQTATGRLQLDISPSPQLLWLSNVWLINTVTLRKWRMASSVTEHLMCLLHLPHTYN